MKKLRSTQANALVITMFLVTVLAAFITVAYNMTAHNALNSHRSTEMNSAYSIADGAVELVYARWRYAMKSTSTNLNVQQLTSGNNAWGDDITNVDLPTLLGADNAAAAPFTINAITLTHVDIYGRPQPDTDAIDPSKDVVLPSDPVYFSASPVGAGFTGFNIIYEAKVWVTSNLHGSVKADGTVVGNPVTVGVKRYFTKSVSPTMQAAIFYEGQLELHPGSNMLISGLVHTNDNLYACGYAGTLGNSTLTFADQVSHAGYYNRDGNGPRKLVNADRPSYVTDTPSEDANTSNPTFTNGATLQQTARMSIGGVNPDDLHPDNTTGKVSYNDDSYREVIERPVRDTTSGTYNAADDPSKTSYDNYYGKGSDPSSIATQRLYNQASLKILLNAKADGTVGVTIRRATQIDPKTGLLMADGPLVLTSSALYKDIVKAINPGPTNVGVDAGVRTALPDNREASNGAGPVEVSVVDMAKIKAAIATDINVASSTDANYFNGVLYIADVTGADAATGSYNDQKNGYNQYTDVETSGDNRVKHGIMLTNAAELPQNTPTLDTPSTDHFFTLASDNAVYVKGDYNTGGYGSNVPTNVDPNSADTWNKANVAYTPVTAALLADAVAVVSNLFDPTKAQAANWDYYQSDPSKTSLPTYVGPNVKYQSANPSGAFYVPPGDPNDGELVTGKLLRGSEPTTVNTAVVSGNTPTNGTVSSGGAQNLVRLLENWSDPDTQEPINFTYKGSLMQSFVSKEFNGNYAVGNNYQQPNRQVRFDSSFLTAPPKSTPTTIVYVRGTWKRFMEPIPTS